MHIWLLHLVFRVSGISHRWVLCLFLVFGGIVLGEMTQTATFGPLKVLLVFHSSLSKICVCCVCLFLSLFLISKICNVGHIDSHTFCFLNEILQRLLDVTCFCFSKSKLYELCRRFLVGALSFSGKMPEYSSDRFLVGAFPLREKCPTIAVTVFFQTTILTLIGPLFLQFLQS